MKEDFTSTLRSLDPADRDVDPSSARARTDLARILSTDLPDKPPKSSRTVWRLALAGAMAAAAAATVVALPSITGGDRAYATWTPNPQSTSQEAQVDAAAECREAQEDGPGTEYANELSGADAVIVERRGVWTTVVLADQTGFAAMCITDSSTGLFEDWFGSIGTPSDHTTPGPRELFATDLGTGGIDAGDLSLAAGTAGQEVAKVVYRSRDHGEVAATVSRGRFALWLPGNELENAATKGVQVEVTYTDGSTGTIQLRL